MLGAQNVNGPDWEFPRQLRQALKTVSSAVWRHVTWRWNSSTLIVETADSPKTLVHFYQTTCVTIQNTNNLYHSCN